MQANTKKITLKGQTCEKLKMNCTMNNIKYNGLNCDC